MPFTHQQMGHIQKLTDSGEMRIQKCHTTLLPFPRKGEWLHNACKYKAQKQRREHAERPADSENATKLWCQHGFYSATLAMIPVQKTGFTTPHLCQTFQSDRCNYSLESLNNRLELASMNIN